MAIRTINYPDEPILYVEYVPPLDYIAEVPSTLSAIRVFLVAHPRRPLVVIVDFHSVQLESGHIFDGLKKLHGFASDPGVSLVGVVTKAQMADEALQIGESPEFPDGIDVCYTRDEAFDAARRHLVG